MQGTEDRKASMAAQDGKIREKLGKVGRSLIVMSGKGGVGKSTVAVNLAAALAGRGKRVGLMDTDIHGPNTQKMLGLNDARLMSDENGLIPAQYSDNLGVISIAGMLEHPDTAVIWRGPMKIGVIRQFISDVNWGDLDFLVVDSPPGTGDEPLTVAQTIPGAEAVIVTTPQDVSLMDIRKSIGFCRQVNLKIAGIVENMSGLACPHCGKTVDVFKSGGGERTAAEYGLPFLGKIPLDPSVVEAGDGGRPVIDAKDTGAAAAAMNGIVEKLVAAEAGPEKEAETEKSAVTSNSTEGGSMKIAVPMSNGVLAAHFGHCEHFVLVETSGKDITGQENQTPPAHEPGVLPKWLKEQGANMIIAGGMGQRAQQLFAEAGIQVICGASAQAPAELVRQYLDGSLVTGQNICDH